MPKLGSVPPFDAWVSELPSDFVESWGLDAMREEHRGLIERTEKKIDCIADLIEVCAEDGTHSILDVTDTSPEPKHGHVSPLPETQLAAVFGTVEPTKAIVEQKQHEIPYRRGTGWYFSVYSRGERRWLCFVGVSGD